jgi:hypothetical protein
LVASFIINKKKTKKLCAFVALTTNFLMAVDGRFTWTTIANLKEEIVKIGLLGAMTIISNLK